ncbi:biotin transporter BioY [Brevundimonas sp. VNH65]|uniref:biotin transporter BioY n=1 Tax=Brevundimonas sp. VNH65 TaxID=3400917 RepID=UPI003BFC6DF0
MSETRFDRRRAFLALAMAAVMAASAQINAPMHPVPMTLQSAAVLLAGVWLGPAWGVASVLIYLGAAAIGLPVLAEGAGGAGRFLGPTAGYLFAFPVAAGLAGEAARRGWMERPAAGIAIPCAAHVLLLGLGTAWLARSLGWGEAAAVGFMPFLIGAVVKSGLVWLVWRGLRKIRP